MPENKPSCYCNVSWELRFESTGLWSRLPWLHRSPTFSVPLHDISAPRARSGLQHLGRRRSPNLLHRRVPPARCGSVKMAMLSQQQKVRTAALWNRSFINAEHSLNDAGSWAVYKALLCSWQGRGGGCASLCQDPWDRPLLPVQHVGQD